MLEALLAFVQSSVDKYPWFATIVMVIGILRVVIKPLMSIARAIVEVTPNPKDNLKLDELEKGNVMKSLYYVLDWFASIKIGTQAK
jgi:hypothetical protein